jgi:hypothetical protein
MSEPTIKIKFTGSPIYRRIVGAYEWSPENDHTADVDLETAADLLTSPEGDFALIEKPKPAIRSALAEKMGIAAADLIIMEPEPVKAAGPVVINLVEEPVAPAEEANNG